MAVLTTVKLGKNFDDSARAAVLKSFKQLGVAPRKILAPIGMTASAYLVISLGNPAKEYQIWIEVRDDMCCGDGEFALDVTPAT